MKDTTETTTPVLVEEPEAPIPAPASGSNCPFYGRYYFRPGPIHPYPFALMRSVSNQCALITTAHAPCKMETLGLSPDWKLCPVMAGVIL